jgi:succinyl-CoA synthetase alpha subunit
MAILIDHTKRVLVQGITGREGMARTQLMIDYGTQIVAGVTPGKGGQTVLNVPVFNTVSEACLHTGPIDISVLFVPAPLVKNAALEAIEGGIKLLVIVPDRVPLYDVLEIAAVAQKSGARFIGPNTLGVLSPGQAVVGMMGGRAESIREWAKAGPVGIISRSGGITTSMGYYISQAGHGLSTLVHVGGDAVVGMNHADVLRMFQEDDQTKVIVLFGEIGTSQEEEAADLMAADGLTKPLIAYISGKAVREGTRFSHAGAIIEGGRGTYASKVARLEAAGARIAKSFTDIPALVTEALKPKVTLPKSPAKDATWTTAITDVQPNAIRLRGYPIDELMGSISFSQAIYLALTGNLPDARYGRMLDAILVSSIDHGVTPPSTLAARTATSTGAPINAGVAVGLLSINEHHGGAIEICMQMIESAMNLWSDGVSAEQAAAELVTSYLSEKKRLPGFGHRVHTDDPRTKRLIEIAESEGIAGRAVLMAQTLRQALAEQSNKPLPLNVDGAIAAILLDMGIESALGNTFFMMSRVPGLIAQIREEQTRERPMRVIDPRNHRYDGFQRSTT